MIETPAEYHTRQPAKATDLKDLSDAEILDMPLEQLAYLFLADFYEHNKDVPIDKSVGIPTYTRYATNNTGDHEVNCAVYEAYQWLYNKGYLMRYIDTTQDHYFVTRAGKAFLSANTLSNA